MIELDPKNKLHSFLVCSFALIVCILLWSSEEPTPGAIPNKELQKPQANSENIKTAIAEIKLEGRVLDLHHEVNAPIEWHIGVLDDGTKRHGYASYICSILKTHNLINGDTIVRIVDVQKIKQGKNFRKASLGRVNCHSGISSYP